MEPVPEIKGAFEADDEALDEVVDEVAIEGVDEVEEVERTTFELEEMDADWTAPTTKFAATAEDDETPAEDAVEGGDTATTEDEVDVAAEE